MTWFQECPRLLAVSLGCQHVEVAVVDAVADNAQALPVTGRGPCGWVDTDIPAAPRGVRHVLLDPGGVEQARAPQRALDVDEELALQLLAAAGRAGVALLELGQCLRAEVVPVLQIVPCVTATLPSSRATRSRRRRSVSGWW